MDESIVVFVKLRGSVPILCRFSRYAPEWTWQPLEMEEQRQEAVSFIRSIQEFGPYHWTETWMALLWEWAKITRRWPTLVVTLEIIQWPRWRYDQRFLPAIWTLQVAQGQPALIAVAGGFERVRQFEREMEHCYHTMRSRSSPASTVIHLDEGMPEQTQSMEEAYNDACFAAYMESAQDFLPGVDYGDYEETTMEEVMYWTKWVEKRHLAETADEDGAGFSKTVDQLQDLADQDLNPLPYRDPDDDLGTWELEERARWEAEDQAAEIQREDMIRKSEEWAAESKAQRQNTTADKTASESVSNDTENWDWPDDLPF